MTPNAHLSVVLLAVALLVGFGRHLGTVVFDVLPNWASGVLSGSGSMLTVVALVIAVQAYRERPIPPRYRGEV